MGINLRGYGARLLNLKYRDACVNRCNVFRDTQSKAYSVTSFSSNSNEGMQNE